MSSSDPSLGPDDDYNYRTHLAFNCTTHDMTVLDFKSQTPVPCDGTTLGEVAIRGNGVMKGYYKNRIASNKAFTESGYFLTGDIGVLHPSYRVEVKDRSKDIIISGGENICSVELENTLLKHAGILEVAVVAKRDDHWGEVPCAFVKVDASSQSDVKTTHASALSEAELIHWCRGQMARYKVPKKFIVVAELPRTSTGKVQKNVLRDIANDESDVKY